VSTAHRALCKRDLRFKRVYEAWEASRDVERGLKAKREAEVIPNGKKINDAGGSASAGGVGGGKVDDDREADHGRDSYGNGSGAGGGIGGEHHQVDNVQSDFSDSESETEGERGLKGKNGRLEEEDSEDSDDDGPSGLFADRRGHSHALHKQVSKNGLADTD
jgi:hypothetical protein